MSWMNMIFFAIMLNTIVGTSAFIVLRIFTAMAINFGTLRVVYPIYKTVQVFCILPGCILYGMFVGGMITDPLSDSFIARIIFYVAYVVWAVG